MSKHPCNYGAGKKSAKTVNPLVDGGSRYLPEGLPIATSPAKLPALLCYRINRATFAVDEYLGVAVIDKCSDCRIAFIRRKAFLKDGYAHTAGVIQFYQQIIQYFSLFFSKVHNAFI
jgi:hypothetical protein